MRSARILSSWPDCLDWLLLVYRVSMREGWGQATHELCVFYLSSVSKSSEPMRTRTSLRRPRKGSARNVPYRSWSWCRYTLSQFAIYLSGVTSLFLRVFICMHRISDVLGFGDWNELASRTGLALWSSVLQLGAGSFCHTSLRPRRLSLGWSDSLFIQYLGLSIWL